MILGFEHVTLSCDDVNGAVKILSKIGYSPILAPCWVENHVAKAPLLHKYEPTMYVALLDCPNATRIEIARQSEVKEHDRGAYGIVFETLKDGVRQRDEDLRAVSHITELELASIPFAALSLDEVESGLSSARDIRGVSFLTSDITESSVFWAELLGVEAHWSNFAGRRLAKLPFKAAFPRWSLDLYLLETHAAARPKMLDDQGFTNLALIVSDLSHDRDVFVSAGAEVITEVFSIEIGGQSVLAELFRAPSGQIIEVVQVPAKR